MFKKIGVYLGSAAVLAAASVSSAFAAVEVGGITDSIADVNTVGAAIISVLVAVAAFKYVRKAF